MNRQAGRSNSWKSLLASAGIVRSVRSKIHIAGIDLDRNSWNSWYRTGYYLLVQSSSNS